MADWTYEAGDPAGALDFFRTHRVDMRALRRVIVGPDGTEVKDINGAVMELSGLTLGHQELEALLKLAGASYNPATLHNPPLGRDPNKTFEVIKHDPWGQDRVL